MTDITTTIEALFTDHPRVYNALLRAGCNDIQDVAFTNPLSTPGLGETSRRIVQDKLDAYDKLHGTTYGERFALFTE